MELQDYLNRMIKQNRDRSFKDSTQITLGELIAEIEKAGTQSNNDKHKTISFDFGSAIPTTLDSWRGSYNELALGYALSGYDGEADYEECTAVKLLHELKNAVGKTYTGWKGGDYIMQENTPLWVANPGNSDTTGIIGILDKGYRLIILTAYCEF